MRWLLVYIFFMVVSGNLYAQHHYFSGGDSSTVFLCQNGFVYVSGKNGLGQLGRGTLPGINSPDIVSGIGGFGTLYNIKQVSGKQYNTLIALSAGGDTVVTWGSNSNGQLGNNLYGNQYTNNNRFPYRVNGAGGAGSLTGIKAVEMGLRTGYAITKTGKVVAWGSANFGSLGNGTSGPDMLSPVYVLKAPNDTLKNVVSVSAGDDCAWALLSDGTVWAWGRGDVGQLGQNINTASTYAIQVKGRNGVGFLTNIISISSSGTHVLALSSKDTLWAWGNNSDGQLGNNSNVDAMAPIVVLNSTATGPLRNVTAIAADWRFSMALRGDSTISVWGNNASYQFGNNTSTSSLIPTKVLDEAGIAPIRNIIAISTFNLGAFARRANGDLLVWGDNDLGELGLGDFTDRRLPVVLTLPCILASLPAFSKGTISGPSSVCGVTNSGTVTVSGFTGAVVAWQSSTNNFVSYTTTSSASSTFNFTNITQKTSYRAVIQYNHQIGYSDSLVVQVNPSSVGGTLGSAATVCASANSGTLTLTGYMGNILRWESSVDSFATAGVPITNTTSTHVYNNLSSTQFFRAVVQNGSCVAANSSIVKITVDPATAGGAISSTTVTVCATSNGDVLTLSGHTGTIVQWEYSTDGFTTVNPITNTTTTYNYLNLTTTTQYRVQIKSGVCAAAYSSLYTVSVDQATVPGTLGAADTVCSGSNSGTLSLTGYTGGITQWETSSDDFTTVNPVSNTTSSEGYTNLTATTSYRVLVRNGVCPPGYSNTVKITVDNPTLPGTISPANTVCFGTNSGSMTLSGHTGNILYWEYSSDNFTGFINNISNTTVTNNYSNLTVTTYYRAQVQNGVCPPQYSSTNIITVDPLSSGGSVSPSSSVVCSAVNAGTITLSAHVGNVLEWQSSTDNFTSVITPISNTTTSENYANLVVTTYYRARIQSGVCGAVYSPVATVTVTPTSAGGILNSSATVCSGTNGATLTLSGHTGNIIRWEYSTDGFVSDVDTIFTNLNTYAYSNLTTSTQYRVRVQNGSCAGTYSSVATINVDAPSAAGTLGTATTVCSGSAVTLTLGGAITGSVVQWESSTDNFGTITNPIANTTTTYNEPNIISTTSYRVRVKNGVCNSTVSNVVMIAVDALTVGGTVNTSTSECSGTNTGTLTLTGHMGAILRWESSTDNFTTITTIANTGTAQGYTNLTATTQYRAILQNGVCSSQASARATITIYPVTVGGIVNSPDTVCFGFNSGTLTLQAGSYTGNILQWESSMDNFVSAPTIISNTTASQNYSNLVNTMYYRVLVKNGNCTSQFSSTVEITVNPNSVGGTISGSDTVCISSNAGTLRLSGYLGTVVQWETSTDNFSSVIVPVSNTTDTIAYSNLTTTTYFRAQIQNTGCAIAYPSPAIVKVDPASGGGTLTAPAVVCASANSGVIKLAGHTGDIVRWETSTDNFTSDTPVANTTDSIEYLNLPVTTYYRSVVKSGVCPLTYSNVTAVTVNPASVGGNIIGAKNICIEGNGSQLILSGWQGNIIQWETSDNNFISSDTILNTTNTFTYSNIIIPLSVRALVQYSPCPAAYSDVFTFIINPATVGGIITGNTQIKKGESSGTLTLTNFTGAVLEWEYSADTSAGWNSIPVSSNVYSFTSLDTSVYIRVNVKSGNCINRYSDIFYIRVVNEVNTEIKIYPTISPNADLINDEWIIDNITLYPSNQVRIFNRWGDMVYEARGYDNASKVWKGQSNTHFTALGQDLPEGTYFYVVDPGNGKPEFSGYVVLNR